MPRRSSRLPGRSAAPPAGSVPPRGRWWKLAVGLSLPLLAAFATGALVVQEMRTSNLQAGYLASLARELGFEPEPGASERIRFPSSGPYDQRLGYTEIPRIQARLEERGFRVTQQARVSERFEDLMDRGLFPIYPARTQAGLELLDHHGEQLFSARFPGRIYADFDSVPEAVWRTLAFIEDRQALDLRQSRKNPAVDWARFGRSVFELGLRTVGSDRNVPGASTLATQMEKFRHSPEGLTQSPRDKLAQMASASIRAYLEGEETVETRRQIVKDYVNSVPLAAIRGQGEITGIGDGLWAWFGTDFDEANALLRGIPLPEPPEEGRLPVLARRASASPVADGPSGEVSERAAEVYRQVLSLFLSQRRPTYYLARNEGREDLAELTDRYLRLLEREGVIGSELAALALEARPGIRTEPPPRAPVDFVARKAANSTRAQLLPLLGVPSLYELDRYDLTVEATIDGRLQDLVTEYLRSLADPDVVRREGLDQYRLLDRGDPSKVIYSFSLHERTPEGNVVRVQADNLDAPFDLNESARLELGSTAKLRTLVSYLEVVEDLHAELSSLSADSLHRHPVSGTDRLGQWAASYLRSRPDASLREMLDAAMARHYSAHPGERFFTGGGVQTFSNFDNTFDHRSVSVREGFRHSVNLVFVRMMRDVVNYHMFRVPGSTARVLDDREDPVRREYLSRFADLEGIQFLDRFFPRYAGKDREEILSALVEGRRLAPQRVAWAYRTVVPDATQEEFATFLRTHFTDADYGDGVVSGFFNRADPDPHGLPDLGFLASVHPLELWVARYLVENPGAGRTEVLEASAEVRQEVYGWLFRTTRRGAQDQRIRTILEMEAFQAVHEGWRRHGYPFGNIVPSIGSSIGSSGDRPAALAELMGIILNDGIRYRPHRVRRLHFAAGTPYETVFEREPTRGERVLSSEVAAVLREALEDVVAEGTGRRLRGAFLGVDGAPVPVGGKTGTGDNRFRVYAPGGRLVESRVVNRTSTFVFYLGDRYYGVISAYVPGADAAGFRFTSSLPAQILRNLGPEISALLWSPEAVAEE